MNNLKRAGKQLLLLTSEPWLLSDADLLLSGVEGRGKQDRSYIVEQCFLLLFTSSL
jgi:hypothetical protein